MSSQKLRAKSLLINTSGNSTNISINRTSKYLIYVHAISAPRLSKIENWNSVACWFSHIFSTRLSQLLDRDKPFEDAYVKTMATMHADLRKHYDQSEIDKIKLNFICVLPTDGGVIVYHEGNDVAVFQTRGTGKLVFARSNDVVRCDVTKLPSVDIIPDVYTVSVFNNEFCTACAIGQNFVDMCGLDYIALEHKAEKFISANSYRYVIAYCTMHVGK